LCSKATINGGQKSKSEIFYEESKNGDQRTLEWRENKAVQSVKN